jgi:hypothetical protein
LRGDAAGQGGPSVRPIEHASVEHRDDRERQGRQGADEESGSQQEIGSQAHDREADGGEKRDEHTGERGRRLQHEQELRLVVLRPQRWVRKKQRQARRQQRGQDDLAP